MARPIPSKRFQLDHSTQPRRLNGVARNHDLARALEMPSAFAVIVHTGRAAAAIRFDTADHGEVTDFSPGAYGRGIQVTSALCLALVAQPVTQKPR